ncbi:hypothetical protein M9H77_03125 [Catharanthus roseus]|uniref:Uncharacterized protein n=1 Tax=Catharanthus roseus TaxID=4058 RepID=A0ACC0CAM0_CATRO|nr:hypothetical protein M9H77_03125 [Catharanthus roseus]
MTTSENCQLFIRDGRYNHKIAVYNHGHAQASRLTEEQLKQTKQFMEESCAATAQKIYNVIAKLKKSRIQGRNMVEEVLYLSAQQGYTVIYRNDEESNVLSDIVVAYPTSIAMIRTWPYVLIIDTTYKTNKYNMPLLEAVGMTLTGKNFTMAIAFTYNEQAMTYR